MNIPTNLKVIESGNIPNTATLLKGEMAFGKVPSTGNIRLFVNTNNTISELQLNVQPDWNATTGAAQILNKPNLSLVATSGLHNDLTGRDVNDSHPVSAITNAVEEVENLPSNLIFEQTNKIDGSFKGGAIGQDGKLYLFTQSPNAGIWFLDDDGEIKQTNKTTQGFFCCAMGQDNKLYFGGDSNVGIWYLDDDGQIKQSYAGAPGVAWFVAAIGQDNKLYFAGQSGGIVFLDNDGVIKPTNYTTGVTKTTATMGQDGKLYFGSGGVVYLDNDGQIKETNKPTEYLSTAAIGQDGKLYLVSYTVVDNTGIWYLDNDGIIKQTNKTNGYFATGYRGQGGYRGQDGRVYFPSRNNTGIWFLNDNGQIQQTNKTTGNFNLGYQGFNNKLYFVSSDNTGIWYLDEDGLIKQLSEVSTSQSFQFGGFGQDSKLYLGVFNSGTAAGISSLSLNIPENYNVRTFKEWVKLENIPLILDILSKVGNIQGLTDAINQLSVKMPKTFKVDGNSASPNTLALNLLNGLQLTISGTTVAVRNTNDYSLNLDIRRSNIYDASSVGGTTSDGYTLNGNTSYTLQSLTTSQLSSAATNTIYLRDNTNNILYILYYFISGASTRTSIWGSVVQDNSN